MFSIHLYPFSPHKIFISAAIAILTCLPVVSEEAIDLWDPAIPFPETLSDIPPLPYATYTLVQFGEEGVSQYLHESGLAWFNGVLYTAWASAREEESADDKHIMGRYSKDGGRTWSEAIVIAPPVEGPDRREYASFAEKDGRLHLFTTRIHSGWSFSDPRLELFRLKENSLDEWEYLGIVCEDDFVATDKPQLMDNGRWIFSGMRKEYVDGKRIGRNRIAISEPDDLTQWTVTGINHPEGMRFPFSTFIIEGADITAIVRNSVDTFAMVAFSEDYGKNWSEAKPTNLPATGNKSFAGMLSTGQRYFIGVTPERPGRHLRKALTIMVSEPDSTQFSKIWRISRGMPHPMRYEGRGKGPGAGQWSYAKAVEHNDHLYVIYTVNKEDAEMAIIPLEFLR